ncbi:hypothetical protein [Frigoribacterium sp. UYMn621]|uniref:hypothetical protein n=1 Tax=Frigoribacterium sp. UYMn621 TaxID=3156343 RepID=UPI0033975C4A
MRQRLPADAREDAPWTAPDSPQFPGDLRCGARPVCATATGSVVATAAGTATGRVVATATGRAAATATGRAAATATGRAAGIATEAAVCGPTG